MSTTKILAPVLLALGVISPALIPTTVSAEAPSATCHSLTAQPSDDKNYYNIAATASADNSTNITGYLFDFGDRESYTFNFNKESAKDRQQATVKHTYAKPGNYTLTASVIGSRDGETKRFSSSDCTVGVAVGSTPAVLPATGPDLLSSIVLNITVGILTYAITYVITQHRARSI